MITSSAMMNVPRGGGGGGGGAGGRDMGGSNHSLNTTAGGFGGRDGSRAGWASTSLINTHWPYLRVN